MLSRIKQWLVSQNRELRKLPSHRISSWLTVSLTPFRILQSNGISEAFEHTLKRDLVCVWSLADDFTARASCIGFYNRLIPPVKRGLNRAGFVGGPNS
ncbi:hypothetical protein QE363_000074 [Sphingomonas sp. SORGH_AS870]|nr:hypothetical protein [Sphingomonas sp. SORGH_AS_0870]